MTAADLAWACERLVAVGWLAMLVALRRPSDRARWTAALLVAVASVASPVAVAYRGDVLAATVVFRVLLLAALNTLLALIWGASSRVPKMDLVCLGLILATSAALVLMLLADAIIGTHHL